MAKPKLISSLATLAGFEPAEVREMQDAADAAGKSTRKAVDKTVDVAARLLGAAGAGVSAAMRDFRAK